MLNGDVFGAWTVSFKGTLQTLNPLLSLLTRRLSTETWCDEIRCDETWCDALLTAIDTHAVDDRPDRYESCPI